MGTTKDGRWFRLDAGWRAEREPRRAGRAGREVFLAACELAAGQAWRIDGEGGWLPDAKFDVLEVAALLGVLEDDAEELSRLSQGLEACQREGLLVRDDANHGWLISRDWWARMVPDRTARDRKREERARKRSADPVTPVTASAVTSTTPDAQTGAPGASDVPAQAPAQARSRSVTPQNGTRRDTRDSVSTEAPSGVVGAPVTAETVTSRHGTRRNEVESSTGGVLSPSSKSDGVRAHAPSESPKPRPLPPGVAIRGEYTPPQAPTTSTPAIAAAAKAAMRQALGGKAAAAAASSAASTPPASTAKAVGGGTTEPAASSTPPAVSDAERGLRAEVEATYGRVGRSLANAGLTAGDVDRAVRGISRLAEGDGPHRRAAREHRLTSPRDRDQQWLRDALRIVAASDAVPVDPERQRAEDERLKPIYAQLREIGLHPDFHLSTQAKLLLAVQDRMPWWEAQALELITEHAAFSKRQPVSVPA